MTKLWIIYGLVFIASILVIEGIYWLVFDLRRRGKTINRRLSLSEKTEEKAVVLEMLRGERGLSEVGHPALERFNDFFVQTGVRVSKTYLALSTLILAAAIGGLTWRFLSPPGIAFGIGLIAAPGLVFLYLSRLRRKRIAQFALQLPDALDIIVRGLRVGHPFTSAIELVAREMPDPIGSELGMCADEITFGKDIQTAVEHLYRRVGQEDLMFFAIAVSVQSQTGGNLADILSRLGSLMRERVMMALKVTALTAEGRMSAWFLTAMPFILYGIVQLVYRDYFTDFVQSALFIPGLIYIVASLIIANFVIYKMVNFKV